MNAALVEVRRGLFPDDRVVCYNGVCIGEIHLGWKRHGGSGWTSVDDLHTHKTQREAAQELARRTLRREGIIR